MMVMTGAGCTRTQNIKVWRDAIDLSANGSGPLECVFHYTAEIGFQNITNSKKKAAEIFASLITEGDKANAWWGKGVYTVRKAPDEWPDVQKLLDNNFRNMLKRDIEMKGLEVARGISSPSRVLHPNPFSFVYQHWCFCEPNTGDVGTEQAARDKLGGQKPGWTTMRRCPHRRGRPSCQCERCLGRDPSPAGVYCIREVRATDRRIIKSRFPTWRCTAWARSLRGGRAVAAPGSWKHGGFFRPQTSRYALLSEPSCWSPEVSRQVHWGRAALPQSPWRLWGYFGAQTSRYTDLSEQSCLSFGVSKQVHWGRAAPPQSPWRQGGHFGAQTSRYAHLSEQSCWPLGVSRQVHWGRAALPQSPWRQRGHLGAQTSRYARLSEQSCWSPGVSRQVHWGRAALPQSPWRQRGHFGPQTSRYAHLSEQSCLSPGASRQVHWGRAALPQSSWSERGQFGPRTSRYARLSEQSCLASEVSRQVHWGRAALPQSLWRLWGHFGAQTSRHLEVSFQFRPFFGADGCCGWGRAALHQALAGDGGSAWERAWWDRGLPQEPGAVPKVWKRRSEVDSEHADHLSSPLETGAAKIGPSFADCLPNLWKHRLCVDPLIECDWMRLIHWLVEWLMHIVMWCMGWIRCAGNREAKRIKTMRAVNHESSGCWMPLMAQVHSPENGAKNVQDLSY